MIHRNFASIINHDPITDTTDFAPSLVSPFSYTFITGDNNMIKQAAPQHPHALTKLQHRLLYESDSESSLDLSFSSPSSIGTASAYSDVGSRTGSSRFWRNAGQSSSNISRSESISSVLGSSIDIQRLMMGADPASTRTSKPSPQRQSVRAIASAFEEVGRSSTMPAPPKRITSQLARVDEQRVPSNIPARTSSQASSMLPTSRSEGSLSSASHDTPNSRFSNVGGAMPARLKIVKQTFTGPSSAPAITTSEPSETSALHPDASNSTSQEPHFVFPPRTPIQQQKQWPYDNEARSRVRSFISLDGQYDDDEPAFEIIPSPSRKRSEPLHAGAVASTPAIAQQASDTLRVSLSRGTSSVESSPALPSSVSAASRDSLDSIYSLDSLSGHPFSLQFAGDEDDRDLRASSAASMQDPNELDNFSSPFIRQGGPSFVTPPSPIFKGRHEAVRQPTQVSAKPVVDAPGGVPAARTLKPLTPSTSRPSSSSSTTTLTPSATSAPSTLPTLPIASMKVNQDTTFPLPPGTTASTLSSKSVEGKPASTREAESKHAVGLDSGIGADQSLAMSELKRQAAQLLASIRSLGDEIDNSIPPTHRLPGSALRPAVGSSSNSSTSCSSGGSSGSSSAESASSFVAVDETYSDIWRLMDSWYWSSFEVGPKQVWD